MNDTEIAGDRITRDTRIAGTMDDGTVSYLYRFEVDLNNDATAEFSLWDYYAGLFQFEFDNDEGAGYPYGAQTIRVRAVEFPTELFDPEAAAYEEWMESFALRSDWVSFSFTHEPDPLTPPQITSLGLIRDTGIPTDGLTNDSRLAGFAEADGAGVESCRIEFDLTGDDLPEQTAVTGADGNFTHNLAGLADGPIAVRARAGIWDAYHNSYVFGDWTAFAFTFRANTAPQIAQIADQTIDENASAGPFSFTIDDTDTFADDLTLSVVASNPTLVPDSGIAIEGTGNSRTITITPAANQSGSAAISIFVTDEEGLRSTRIFTLTVRAANRPPVAFAQTVGLLKNTQASFVLSGNDGNPTANQTLTFELASQPSHGTITSFDPATGAVTYVPALDYFGPDSFTFTVQDDSSLNPASLTSDPKTVSITVAQNNRPPVLAPIGDKTTTEGSTLAFRAMATDPDATRLFYAIQLYGADGESIPIGSMINADTGLFLWAPDESEGPEVYTAIISVADSGSPSLQDSETIQITVEEHNAGADYLLPNRGFRCSTPWAHRAVKLSLTSSLWIQICLCSR